jgi:hypothetical protein
MAETMLRLERRIARIEKDIRDLRDLITRKQSEPWWQRTAGMFEGDELFAEIVEEMRKQREADYRAVCAALDAEGTARKPGWKSRIGRSENAFGECPAGSCMKRPLPRRPVPAGKRRSLAQLFLDAQ